MRSLKTVIQKKFSYYKQMFLINLNPRAALYEDKSPEIEVGLQRY